MLRRLASLAILAISTGAFAGTYIDSTANNSFATAAKIDDFFTVDFSPDIGAYNGSNISLTAPHVTIIGHGNDAFDYYRFTTAADSIVILDIDYTSYHPTNPNGFASVIALFGKSGTGWRFLGQNDGEIVSAGAGGSNMPEPEPVRFSVCRGHEMIPKGTFHDRCNDDQEDQETQTPQAHS